MKTVLVFLTIAGLTLAGIKLVFWGYGKINNSSSTPVHAGSVASLDSQTTLGPGHAPGAPDTRGRLPVSDRPAYRINGYAVLGRVSRVYCDDGTVLTKEDGVEIIQTHRVRINGVWYPINPPKRRETRPAYDPATAKPGDMPTPMQLIRVLPGEQNPKKHEKKP